MLDRIDGLCILLSLEQCPSFRYVSCQTQSTLVPCRIVILKPCRSVLGIVSLLFCGITLKHYAYESMSPRSKRTTKSLFQVLAQLSENFIFIYLGLTLFTETDLDYKPAFILFTFVSVPRVTTPAQVLIIRL